MQSSWPRYKHSLAPTCRRASTAARATARASACADPTMWATSASVARSDARGSHPHWTQRAASASVAWGTSARRATASCLDSGAAFRPSHPRSALLCSALLCSALRGGWDRRSDARLGLACGCRQAVGAWPKASLNVSIHVGSELWHGEAELAQYAGFPPETRASGSSYRFTSADASIVRPLDLQDERGPASTESKSYANTMCTHARSEVPS